ncbi:glycolate oxidase subunit GlcE [Rhodobacteraceae bacterium 2CG4]|uniref:Glycolate oxidase subunit GlcE n=1 Tax=Halovulum marinum TaxID=2662447 RepID=A0A6L5Z339_9RHOB|nr:glycolate oxidase subunit GlcE [Halovulum marinum]MSU90404.1 glycolate oxidase subunit GlcE [Halovulum marinum]
MSPTTESDLAEAVAAAAAAGTPLAIRGGGTRAGLGHAVTGEVLETGGLSGIRLHEPGALTLVAAAGTPLEQIEAALAAENQRLPFEPMDHRALYGTNGAPTIGGVVAANVSGPRRIQAGACRDSLIGVRFVDGRGTVLKNGGRVMKNVTGYDLVKLLAGSHGTLGVLTEVAFKLLPAPESSATLCLHGLTDNAAVAAMSAALGSPFDVTGAAHLPGPADGPITLLRIEGFAESVAYRAGQLRELLRKYADEITERDDAAPWTAVRDGQTLGDAVGDVWRVSVRPTDGPEVRRRAGLDHPVYYDWGGGLVWLLMPKGTDLRAALEGLPGHATLVRGDEGTKARLRVFHPEPAPLARIAAGLRAQFDPQGVLNPGRMGG